MVGEMTFAEAMADGPRLGLEVCDRNGNWIAFDTCGQYQPAFLACATFRRSRPKRSRVQEMAVAYGDTRPEMRIAYEAGARDAIYAVREFLRGPCQHGEDSSVEYARIIERQFLEPQ